MRNKNILNSVFIKNEKNYLKHDTGVPIHHYIFSKVKLKLTKTLFLKVYS